MKLFAKDIPRRSTEVSFLAIVETLTACALALYFTLHPNWKVWLALYICIAPLLLLRSKASTLLGLVWFGRVMKVADKFFEGIVNGDVRRRNWIYGCLLFVAAFLAITILALCALPVKVIATVASAFRWPLSCFRSIPANWVKQVARTDSTLMPELLPGIRTWINTPRGKTVDITIIAGPDVIFKEVMAEKTFGGRLFVFILACPLLILPFAFGLLYRWALKATAVVWMPLAYLLDGVFRKRDSVAWRVKDFMKGPLAIVLLAYSTCVLVFNGLLPFAFRSIYLNTAGWLKARLFPEALIRYFMFTPRQEAPQVLVVQAWHVAGLVSAAITVCLYFWAGTLRNQMESDGFSSEAGERNTLRKIKAMLATRATLTTYTMACGIVAFAKAAEWKWAQFTVQFLP